MKKNDENVIFICWSMFCSCHLLLWWQKLSRGRWESPPEDFYILFMMITPEQHAIGLFRGVCMMNVGGHHSVLVFNIGFMQPFKKRRYNIFNPLCFKLFWRNLDMGLHFIWYLSQLCEDTLLECMVEKIIYKTYMVNIMPVEEFAMYGTWSLSLMVFTCVSNSVQFWFCSSLLYWIESQNSLHNLTYGPGHEGRLSCYLV